MGVVFLSSRAGFSDFNQFDGGYAFDLTLNHAVWGVAFTRLVS